MMIDANRKLSGASRPARNTARLCGVPLILTVVVALLAGCAGGSLPFEPTPGGTINLQGLLNDYPSGGREMARRAASTIAQDPSKAIFLASISQNANEMQQAAIGSALNMAARSIGGNNPHGRTEILSAVARAPKAVRAAYLASSLNN